MVTHFVTHKHCNTGSTVPTCAHTCHDIGYRSVYGGDVRSEVLSKNKKILNKKKIIIIKNTVIQPIREPPFRESATRLLAHCGTVGFRSRDSPVL